MEEPKFEDIQRSAAEGLPELLSAARGTPQPDAILALWRVYFQLPAWITIAHGEVDAPAPFVVVAGDRPTLLVFSSAEGAKATGISAGLSDEDASRLLAVPLPAAIDWVLSLAGRGIQSVQFDTHLDGGVVVPIGNLAAMRATLHGDP